MTGYEHIEHTFAPVYDADSLVLILGNIALGEIRGEPFITAISRTVSGK